MLRFKDQEVSRADAMEIMLPEIKDEKGNIVFERTRLGDLIPKGKDKSVTFQWLNLKPYQVLGSKGMITPPNSKGGEKSKFCFNTVTIPEWRPGGNKADLVLND